MPQRLVLATRKTENISENRVRTLGTQSVAVKSPTMWLSSKTWWLELKQEVVCPKCGQLVHLAIKRGTRTIVYDYHSLPNTSGFINPMFYVARAIGCEMSFKPFPELNDFSQLEHRKSSTKKKK